jgi:hypothetical protein
MPMPMPNRVKEVEREQRNEIKSMRTSESQELGSTVVQEMEKKRKLAELKRLQVLSVRSAARTFSHAALPMLPLCCLSCTCSCSCPRLRAL